MIPTLTIAIPTRNRGDLVREHVALLIPQLTADMRLLILDNASDLPVADALADLIQANPNAQVTVTRNSVNIGSSANVMRCIETCASPWLWILGDDDRPLPDAVQTALNAIKRFGDCVSINFSSMHQTSGGELLTEGLEDFVRRTPNFANTTLISNNLYRIEALGPHVRTGYFYTYSLYPHYVCVLSALHVAGGRCCFLPERLVEWGPDSHWSRLMAAAGMGLPLDLPLPHPVRQLLAPKLARVAGRYSSLTVLLLDQIGNTMDAASARHLHEQAYQRLYRYDQRFRNAVVRWLGRLMLWTPNLSAKLYRNYRRWRGDPRPEKMQDDLSRM